MPLKAQPVALDGDVEPEAQLLLGDARSRTDGSAGAPDAPEAVLRTLPSGVRTLPNGICYLLEQEEEKQGGPPLGQAGASLNLVNTMVGAGLMALPRVFAIAGLLGGSVVMVLAWALAYYSTSAIIRAAELTGASTYRDTVRNSFGRASAWLLQAAIVINNGGMQVVLIAMLGEALAEPGSGLLHRLLPPSLQGSLLMRKPVAQLLCVLCVLVPLCCLRDMRKLSAASLPAVCGAYLLGLFTLLLYGVALCRGLAPTGVRLLPDVAALGGGRAAAEAMLMTLPVASLSFICHYNLLSVKAELPSAAAAGGQRAMLDVTIRALAAATALYVAVGAGGYALFGPGVQEDALRDFSGAALTPLVGDKAEKALSTLVQAIFAAVLACTYPMVNHPLRGAVETVVFRRRPVTPAGMVALTVGMQLALWLVAVAVPGIWLLMQVIGSTCGVAIAYAFPALLLLKVAPSANKARRKLAAYCMLALAVLLPCYAF